MNGAEHGSLGLVKMLQQADALAIGVLIVLTLMSLASWFVILTRLGEQRAIARSYAEARRKFWAAGGLWDVNRATVHHSLWAHNHTRNPKARPNGLLDWVNNVTFDWDIGRLKSLDSHELYAAAGEPKDLWILPGIDHARAFHHAQEEYLRRLDTFFTAALTPTCPALA